MIPKGGREAMGGAEGDTYTLYAGMEAVSMQDIDSLFDDAEVSARKYAFFSLLK
jgi:predicted transcriptional regulator YdeE